MILENEFLTIIKWILDIRKWFSNIKKIEHEIHFLILENDFFNIRKYFFNIINFNIIWNLIIKNKELKNEFLILKMVFWY